MGFEISTYLYTVLHIFLLFFYIYHFYYYLILNI